VSNAAACRDRCRLEFDVPMVSLDEFLPEVVLSAPGVPVEIAKSYIRQAVIDMAEKTNMLQRRVRIDLQSGASNYLLEPPDCTRSIGISEICNIATQSRVRVLPHEPCALACSACGIPPLVGAYPDANWSWWWNNSVAWFQQPNELRLTCAPTCDVELGLWIDLIVAPKRDACEVDRVLYDRYAPTVHAGALMYLYRIPKQDWTDPRMAEQKRQEFSIGTNSAAGDRLMGMARGPIRLVTPRIL